MSGLTVRRIEDFVSRHVKGEASGADRHRAAFDDFFPAFQDAFKRSNVLPEDCQQLKESINIHEEFSCGHIYNEFCIGFELKPRNNFIAPTRSSDPGCVTIKLLPKMMFHGERISGNDTDLRCWDYYKGWCNRDLNISSCKFRNWAKSLINSFVLNSEIVVNGISNSYVIRGREYNPIYSVVIHQLETDIRFNVNFSFCISFNKWPFENWQGEMWSAIADPFEFKESDKIHSWRYSFRNLESRTLQDTNYSKVILGMVAIIRNNYKIYYFMDYFIANICMSERFDSTFWNRDIYVILKNTLKEIIRVLEEGELPFYFDSSINLLSDWNINQKNEAKNCFKFVSDVLDRMHVFEEFGKSLTQQYFDSVMLNRCETPYSNRNINNNNSTAVLSPYRENMRSNLNNNVYQQPQNIHNNRQNYYQNSNQSRNNRNISNTSSPEQWNSFIRQSTPPQNNNQGGANPSNVSSIRQAGNSSNQLSLSNNGNGSNMGANSSINSSGQPSSSSSRQSTPPQNNNQGGANPSNVSSNGQPASTQSNQQGPVASNGSPNNGNGLNNNPTQNPPNRQNHQENQPNRQNHQENPPNRQNHQENPPNRQNHQENQPNRQNHQENPPNRQNHQENPPNRQNHQENPPNRQNHQQNIRPPNRPANNWVQNEPYRMNNRNREPPANQQQEQNLNWEQIGTGVAITGAIVAGLFGLSSLWSSRRN